MSWCLAKSSNNLREVVKRLKNFERLIRFVNCNKLKFYSCEVAILTNADCFVFAGQTSNPGNMT